MPRPIASGFITGGTTLVTDPPAATAAPVFVLVHSPSVGPRTWQPVAEVLRGVGWDAIVPSLRHIAEGAPPFWPHVADAVAQAVVGLDEGRPVILALHSNAGIFAPVITTGLGRAVAGCMFVDASLPARSGETPVAPPELLPFLRSKSSDGVLPPWTYWWDESDVAPMFPDEATRQAVTAEQPRLPLAYYEERVPVPPGSDDRPCAYVLFGPPYDETAAAARARGWPVEHLPGKHLHMIVDPVGVARLLTTLANRAGMASSKP